MSCRTVPVATSTKIGLILGGGPHPNLFSKIIYVHYIYLP